MKVPMDAFYIAIFEGVEYEARGVCDDALYLCVSGEGMEVPSGFKLMPVGKYMRQVDQEDLEAIFKVEWLCEYKGAPCRVRGEIGEDLALD